MKKLLFILVGLLFTSPLFAQNEYQQEIICPCLLEFKFPATFYESGKLVAGQYGGVPVLRFKSASFENNELFCAYEKEFATNGLYTEDPGFGFTFTGDVPYDITLTLKTDYLNDWKSNPKTVKLNNNCRGHVLFPVCFQEEREDGLYFGFQGAFYSGNYEGDAVMLKRTFEGYARLNSKKNGFIISATNAGLYTPAANTEDLSNSTIKKKKRQIKRKKKEVQREEKKMLRRKN